MNIQRRILPGLGAYTMIYLAVLYLPVLLIPLFSLNDSTLVTFPLSGFTLKWYGQLAGEQTMVGALGNSLFVGAIVAIASTALGIFAGRAFARNSFTGSRVAEGVVMLPLVIPVVIVASAMLSLFILVGLKPSLVAIVIGHIFLTVPFSVAIMKSAFEEFDLSLEEAALDLGETLSGTFRRVTLPVIAPGIVASLLITFTVSFDEFVLAFFLSGERTTLPVYIWSQIRFPAKLPNTLALGSLLLLFSVVLLVVAEVFRRKSLTTNRRRGR